MMGEGLKAGILVYMVPQVVKDRVNADTITSHGGVTRRLQDRRVSSQLAPTRQYCIGVGMSDVDRVAPEGRLTWRLEEPLESRRSDRRFSFGDSEGGASMISQR